MARLPFRSRPSGAARDLLPSRAGALFIARSAGALPAMALAVILAGCDGDGARPRTAQPETSEAPAQPMAAQPSSEAETPPHETPRDPGAAVETAPAKKDAVKDLLEKLQTSPAIDEEKDPAQARATTEAAQATEKDGKTAAEVVPPPTRESPPEEEPIEMDREDLTAKASAFAAELAGAIAKATPDEAMKLLVTEEDFKKVLSEGGFTILGSTILPSNQKKLEQLAAAMSGKEIEHEWKPGDLTSTRTGAGIFRVRMPMMTGGVLSLSADGITLRVELRQIIWLDGRWQVFQLSY